MTKTEYLAALQRALADLPDDTTASVIADFAARFESAMVAGQTEEQVARAMPNPGTVASTWWTTARGTSNQSRFDVAAFTNAMPAVVVRPAASVGARAGQILASTIGLVFLNLFMLIPTIVYTAVMGALLIVTLALYGGGIVVASSGFADVDTVMLEPIATRFFSGNAHAATAGPILAGSDMTVNRGTLLVGDPNVPGEGTRAVVHTDLNFLTHGNTDSRSLRVVKGFALTLAAMLALLVWLIVAKYSAVAARHYVALNIAALRGR